MEEIESKQAIEKIELIMEQLQEIKQHLEGAAPKVEEEPEEYDELPDDVRALINGATSWR